jgi:Co/Zn/Cd efflux system component
MAGCTCPAETAGAADAVYRRVLWTALVINAAMFLIEGTGGLLSRSVALQADAIDFLGDTAAYAMSLYVLSRSQRWRAGAAIVKGTAMGLFGAGVLANAAYHVISGTVPHALTMGGIGALALVANLACAGLLLRFRGGDSNRRSIWLCSRNDAIGNVAVVIAASGVFASGAGWPDVAVALVLATLAISACWQVLTQALGELRAVRAIVPVAGDD